MPYLGYDRGALGALLGALSEVGSERIDPRHSSSAWAEPARAAHRRAASALMDFADPIGALLRADPLGRYRPVSLDPADLTLWALHRGGRWATVIDPVIVRQGPQQDLSARNARLVAATLTPGHLTELLDGDGRGARPLLRYLAAIGGQPAARAAFLGALGPSGFAGLVEQASRAFNDHHPWIGPEHPVATLADQVLSGLGGVWANERAAGRLGSSWDGAALGGPLVGASRLLAVAAATPGALTSDDLATWGTALWRRLLDRFGTGDAPQPEVIGDRVLGALAGDGRASRHFLLDLAEDPDRGPLDLLLVDGASSPAASGAVLLASTDPSGVRSATDADEVRRSVQAVARAIAGLLERQQAWFPPADVDPALMVPAYGRVLPADLGLYLGRQVDHMIDPCEGAGDGACPVRSRAWPGWEEREVARLLALVASDLHAESQLADAARAGFVRSIAHTDLTERAAAERVASDAFVLAAVGAVVRNGHIDGALADEERFDRMVAGLDLAVAATGVAVPELAPLVAGTQLWGSAADVGAAGGWRTPGAFALQGFQPHSVREALAQGRADEGVAVAVMKSVVGAGALAQLDRRGALVGAPPPPAIPTRPDAATLALAAGTHPGDDANTAGSRHLHQLYGWLEEAGAAPAAVTVERLLASVGDGAEMGQRWVA